MIEGKDGLESHVPVQELRLGLSEPCDSVETRLVKLERRLRAVGDILRL